MHGGFCGVVHNVACVIQALEDGFVMCEMFLKEMKAMVYF